MKSFKILPALLPTRICSSSLSPCLNSFSYCLLIVPSSQCPCIFKSHSFFKANPTHITLLPKEVFPLCYGPPAQRFYKIPWNCICPSLMTHGWCCIVNFVYLGFVAQWRCNKYIRAHKFCSLYNGLLFNVPSEILLYYKTEVNYYFNPTRFTLTILHV